jgi:cytochrome c
MARTECDRARQADSVDKFDTARGRAVYVERCQSCHGPEGQGVQIGDKKAGPLWGPDSWNDGAGAARVYTLAGIVRYSMPYLDPGSLSDADAQNVAAFINSQTRPHYPFKDRDYIGGKIRWTPSTIEIGAGAGRHEMIVTTCATSSSL